jgi:hypothetical protein
MAMPWTDAVKQRAKLMVYIDPATGRSPWGSIINRGMTEFNQMSRRMGLGVSLVRSQDAPEDGGGGADVQISQGSGQVSFIYAGENHGSTFDGNRLHGLTMLVSRRGVIEKAFIYLPSQPRINTPSGLRAVGSDVKRVILVHELVHACGLENADHSTDDLFQGYPQVDYGSSPSADRVTVTAGGRTRRMPPLYLSTDTAGDIKGLW